MFLLLALAALGSLQQASGRAVDQATNQGHLGKPAQLLLLFSANISAPSCAGQCSIQVKLQACGGAADSSAAGADAGPRASLRPQLSERAALEARNTVAIAWRWQHRQEHQLHTTEWQQRVQAAVRVDCMGPCSPAPAAFVAWQGNACRTDATLVPLPAAEVPGGAGNVWLLMGGQPAVQLAALQPASEHCHAAAAVVTSKPCDGQQHCGMPPAHDTRCAGRLQLFRLGLAAWLAACAALGRRL